jgi:DNA polymerase-3 subunit epsilon
VYAVLDIEATGGKKGEEDIIEVAIYRFDGKKITDQLISLVNPDRKIDAYVQKLTQITPKMVKTAPKFAELAKRIIEITEGCILVGHNVDFDYRMLKQEFKKFGYTYYRETIDTVPLSEKYFPEAASYSLGKLTKELGIPISDRHRAAGDARATLELFKLLLDKDYQKNIVKNEAKPVENASTKFLNYYEDLPNSIGIYYIFDKDKNVIFLSRAVNIAQNVRKLLLGKSNLSNKIRLSIDSIKYQVTGNELISWIKENHEIKRLKPKLNEANRKIEFPYGIYIHDKNGYKALILERVNKTKNEEVLKISSLSIGQKLLSLITEDYELCPKLNEISQTDKCLSFEVGECYGACEGAESTVEYNARVHQFLEKIRLENKSFLIIGNGRDIGESSFVWVENGLTLGYGYFELHHQIKGLKRIKERMIPIENDTDINHMIKGFLFTEKYKDLIYLNTP